MPYNIVFAEYYSFLLRGMTSSQVLYRHSLIELERSQLMFSAIPETSPGPYVRLPNVYTCLHCYVIRAQGIRNTRIIDEWWSWWAAWTYLQLILSTNLHATTCAEVHARKMFGPLLHPCCDTQIPDRLYRKLGLFRCQAINDTCYRNNHLDSTGIASTSHYSSHRPWDA